MKIGFCTMEKFDNRVKDSVGSSRIRASWLIKYWPEAEDYLIGAQYDVLIFQKVYWQAMMQNFKGIKILDLCDPDWLEGKPVLEYSDMADATVTSSQALADYIKKFRPNSRILCIPDRIDLDIHKPKENHAGPAKTIAWFGYSTNIHYIEKCFDDIIAKDLTLTVISDQPYNPPVAYRNLKVVNIPFSWPGVNKEITNCDLVLLPDTNEDLRGTFKSNNKTLSAWALGMPVVKVPQDLDRFMDPAERRKESELRLQEIKDKWDVKLSVKEYQDLIGEIIGRRKDLKRGK